MAKTTIETLIASINTIRESERISKAELSKFSRAAIAFVIETKDVSDIQYLLHYIPSTHDFLCILEYHQHWLDA